MSTALIIEAWNYIGTWDGGRKEGEKKEDSLLVPDEIMREVEIGWGSEGIQVCKHWGKSTGTSEKQFQKGKDKH